MHRGDPEAKTKERQAMRFLQIGLGSMGKRRIRCLKRLGYDDIAALDFRQDRRKEAEDLYHVTTASDIQKGDLASIDIMIISTPPDKHDEYIALAIDNKIPAFVEASVILGRLEELAARAKGANVLIAPSCTLRYHIAIKKIAQIVKSGKFGKVTNFTYHSGQYLPDWHPYENVKDFYVSKKETGAAREIVPFELTWIAGIVGLPVKVTGFCGKTMDVKADIDDTYVLAMEFENGIYGVLNVDAVSRYATRSLILNMEKGQILWRWDEDAVRLYDASSKKWTDLSYSQGKAEKGYNKNIGEDMYVEELSAFIKAAAGKERFPNTLEEDVAILKILGEVEPDAKGE